MAILSILENSTVRGAWQATVHGVAKSQTQLSAHVHVHTHTHTHTSEIQKIRHKRYFWVPHSHNNKCRLLCILSYLNGNMSRVLAAWRLNGGI